MTQEEKAKRFDETLEQLRGLIECTREDKCAIVEEDIINIFPELAESEDEKIRKALIGLIKSKEEDGYMVINNVSTGSILAWLEKQGENPKWSEEDDYNVHCCIAKAESDIAKNGYPGRNKELIDWLKSLKQRIGG